MLRARAALTAIFLLTGLLSATWASRIPAVKERLGLAAAAAAPSLAILAACLLAWAFGNSLVDVAINVQGVELERRRERPLLSSLHAAHSFGLLGGGLAGIAAA